MQRLLKFSPLVFVAVTLLLLAACIPAAAPGGANCQHGICVDVQLSEPIRFNEPVTATVTVEVDQDVPQLGISLWADHGVLVEKPNFWQVEAKAHQPLTFTGAVRFTTEGYPSILASASTPSGVNVADSILVYVTRLGVTANPTLPSGITPQPTLLPSESPLPTPLTNSLLSPSDGEFVLLEGQEFEGAFPPAGWIN